MSECVCVLWRLVAHGEDWRRSCFEFLQANCHNRVVWEQYTESERKTTGLIWQLPLVSGFGDDLCLCGHTSSQAAHHITRISLEQHRLWNTSVLAKSFLSGFQFIAWFSSISWYLTMLRAVGLSTAFVHFLRYRCEISAATHNANEAFCLWCFKNFYNNISSVVFACHEKPTWPALIQHSGMSWPWFLCLFVKSKRTWSVY